MQDSSHALWPVCCYGLFSLSFSVFPFPFCVSRLRSGACSVCPSVRILRARLHHRVLPDTSSHQLRGAADAEVRERIPCCHPEGHAPQPAAGGLLHCQAGGGVPRQHVRGTPQQRWGNSHWITCGNVSTAYDGDEEEPCSEERAVVLL